MTSHQSLWIVQKRAELIEVHGGKCTWYGCTVTEDLEFAHTEETELNGRGRGRHERYYDVRNNPSSYRLLCFDHHRRMDDTNPNQ